MKHSILLLLLFSSLLYADDTEIYGTAGNTTNNTARPNVMFIMDTSGSMNATVINRPTYNPSTTYSGDYPVADVFNSLYDDDDYGHNATSLEHDDSTNCEGVVTALEANGKANGNFEQYRNNDWKTLKDGNNGKIRCDTGNNYWLYTGNYMNWFHNSGTNSGKDRLETVVDVVKNMADSLSDINMGLMRFDQGTFDDDTLTTDEKYGGGYVDVAIENITSSKEDIKTQLNTYTHSGGTPLTEVMYEAARYFRGEAPVYGESTQPGSNVDDSTDGTSYKSPISAQCQKNHIILFTDGEASVDEQSNTAIHNLIANMDFTDYPALNKSCSGDGGCLDELTHWLYQSDHSDSLTGNQSIITYTIGGFDLDSASLTLNSAATHGGGVFYQANNTDGLTEVLTDIFTEILSTDSTFTAPAVSVNAFNASEHRDDLYYALFRPENNVKWGGNLRRYKIQDGVVKANYLNTGSLNSKYLDDGINTETGYFDENSYDLWNNTNSPDGKKVTKGGMANILPSTRTIYSDDTDGDMDTFENVATYTSFNMSESDFDTKLIESWVKGVDVLDKDADGDRQDPRYSIGDPLHSEPVIVTYGGTDESPDSTIYFGTNEGFIHAVNTETGIETFAFLPYELHDIQDTYYTNTAVVGDKPYGMDGPLTTWFKDLNNNKVLYETPGTLDSDEHVYLYAGMRRGGRSYYALDVTDRSSPEMLFKITGGETDGFDRLGQTWSRMTVAKVHWDGDSKFVLFFTGGYDTNQDSNNTREDDSLGNAIYMVDAESGELLWTASRDGANTNITEMKNSIPASISAIDITGDGHVNYFFAADTGGRIFRLDINPNNTGADNFATGGVIAQVGDSSQEGNLRFYNKPNVSLVKDKQLGDFLTIAIGSGYRAHPLNTTIEDRFYMIKDRNPYTAPSTYSTIREASSTLTTFTDVEDIDQSLLYNATSVASSGTITNALRTLISYGSGWYVELGASEKVLAESTTFAGATIFTTFSPAASGSVSTNACGANTGTSKAYALDQQWGLPILDLDGDGDIESSLTLTHSGIAPRPVIIYGPGGTKTIAIGTETIEDKRFDENTPDCDENGTCLEDYNVTQCEEGSCYVTPVYWRQNDNEH